MKKNNHFVNAAKSLASDGLDGVFEFLSNEIKAQFELPIGQSAAFPKQVGFRPAVAELTGVMDYAAHWHEDTLVVLTVPHANRHYQLIACNHGDIVEILLPTNLRYPTGQVPANLAVHVLTRNARIPFGGFDLFAAEGSLSINCRASVPSDAVTGELLYTIIHTLIAEVADLKCRFKEC